MPALNEIVPQHLNRLIGTPDCPRVVDVCLDEDFSLDPVVTPGAIRHPYDDLEGLAAALEGHAAEIVCQKGKKLSHGVAAWLRAQGRHAEVLAGGMEAWRAAGLPSIPFDRISDTALWVTRHRPKIDRIACPWLIRRFINRDAQFLYVPPAEVAAVAERFGALPFDVDGVEFGHHAGRCTFDALLGAFSLRTEPLLRMADVVRAADLGRLEDSPQAAGLLALSVGLSRQFRNDALQLQAGLALYDALFAWARDGYGEEHHHDLKR